jgi:hypothetical protein
MDADPRGNGILVMIAFLKNEEDEYGGIRDSLS